VPDALRNAGEKSAARGLYITLLKRNPKLGCARRALATLNAPPPKPESCSSADSRFDRGDLGGARAAYEAVGSSISCASTGLAAIREVERLCAKGSADRRLDRNDDALAAYKSALDKNPRAACALAGVRSAGPDWISSWSSWVVNRLPEVLTVLGALLLVLFLVLLLGYFDRVHRVFSSVPMVGRLLGARLSLEPLEAEAVDSKIGASMTARIKERMQSLREEALRDGSPDYDLDLGTAGEEFAELVSKNAGGLGDALGKVRDLSPQTKVIGALLDLLYFALPIRRLTVTGTLDAPASAGPAATLSLEEGGKLSSAVTLQVPAQADPPLASEYVRLCQPAAVWVQYEVARVLSGGVVQPNAAESYALVREGLDRQLEGDDLEARRAYERALALNPRNWAARVNLAVVEARLARDFASAIAILSDALTEMEDGAPA